MRKSKSFSMYGRYLETRASLTSNPELLQKLAKRASQKPLEVTKTQPKFIQGFDRVTGRQKLNPFQVFNTRDACTQQNYQIKEELVQTRSSFLPMKTQKCQRMGGFLAKKQFEKGHDCKRHSSSKGKCTDDKNILTARDLQNFRKSHHSFDFNKQSARTNTYIKKPVGNDTGMTENNSFIKRALSTTKLQAPKLVKVHSFESYTKRDFLSDKNLLAKGAPFYSGGDCFKVPLEKYKGGWKTIGAQQFSKSPTKTLSRRDSSNEPFFTKLGYNPKQQLVKKKIPIIDLSQQTPRQINEVHSKYPIRMNI